MEKNGYFGMRDEYQRNVTDSAFVLTRAIRDGKAHEVVEYAGGGPPELWAIERTIEGVASQLEWGEVERISSYPRWQHSDKGND